MMNETHDLKRRSWVESASDPASDFPIQNLPFAVFRRPDAGESWRAGVAIGTMILDVHAAASRGHLGDEFGLPVALGYFGGSLNALMGQSPAWLTRLRAQISGALSADDPAGQRARSDTVEILLPQADAEFRLPAEVGNYTDFYASVYHATNVGSMFRPDNPLLPNYKWVPIGYHGRASSLLVSGRSITRPVGQTSPMPEGPPVFGPTQRLDYELELALFIGRGNPLGTTIPIGEAQNHLFGVGLLNDWSARDVQAWEYQPLGPFLAKNFATTLSPWVVTRDALAPFRCAAFPRPAGDPTPLPYLLDAADQASGGLDVQLEVWLASATMRATGLAPMRVSSGTSRDLYWTPAQMIAHHASGGCNLMSGDVLGTGTVSGPDPESRGCLLERTWRGTQPLTLPTGEIRRFLEDGDEVTLRGRCTRDGFASIGFGDCRGVVAPAHLPKESM